MVEGVWDFTKKTKEFESGGGYVVEQYQYSKSGITVEKIIPDRTDKDGNTIKGYKLVEEILNGELDIYSKVEFHESDKQECKWHIKYCGDTYIGDFNSVIEFIFSYGRTKVTKERLKQAIGTIIANSEIPQKNVYPAVGFFLGKDSTFFANAEDNVFPALDSQSSYLRRYVASMKYYNKEQEKDALKASAEFIESMPKKNQLPALFARAYSFVAPLGYCMKQTIVGVFPYLYLYGQRGCSKTHIGTICSTYLFGETEPLTSDAIGSDFRLGMEFSATTFPRLVDDGEDVFKKNIAMFKSAATGRVATKRGNKDKTLDTYSAFCPFIFTSNSIPIPPEEDAKGSLMDRLLVVECYSGPDFNKEKYQNAYWVLSKCGFAMGRLICDVCAEKSKGGVEGVVKELIEIADKFQGKGVPLRRAYCLAYLVMGIRWYYATLEKNGIPVPIPFEKEETIIDEIYTLLQSKIELAELTPVISFLDFVVSTNRLTIEEQTRAGIYPGTKSEDDSYLIITNNTLKRYKQAFNLRYAPYSDLSELWNDMQRFGFDEGKVTAHKDAENKCRWGIKFGMDKYHELVEIFSNKKQ
jgi:hypothetical protein